MVLCDDAKTIYDFQITFLQTRPLDLDSASLIACGTGGWVQMWNIHGGGLIGEFNIWDNLRHRLDKEDRQLQSVTAMTVDSNNDLLITGNSIGYIQVSKINDIRPSNNSIQTQYTNSVFYYSWKGSSPLYLLC